jgi:formylglycine-generating enzyme required for sulfatase activity
MGNVFNMGAGLTNLETVPVGNVGNIPDTRYFPVARGSVDYAYNIGKYEVTAGQYTEFLNAVAGADPYGLYNDYMDSNSFGCQITRHGASGDYTYDFSGRPSGTEASWANRPVNAVSWGDSARFANWLHNGQPMGTLTGDPAQDAGLTEDGSYNLNGAMSDAELMAVTRKPRATWVLPTEDERYKAAYHKKADGLASSYYDYPTSSDAAPGYVNDSGNLSGAGNPFTEGGVDPGNYVTYNADQRIPGIGSPYYRTAVGEWENSSSPYGTFDQSGNIDEWIETSVLNIYDEPRRGVRGGSAASYSHTIHSLLGGYSEPTKEMWAWGFRVAEVPEPATMAIVALGGIGILRRRRYVRG